MSAAVEFTFSEAAALAGVKPKALRGWLDRKQVIYPSLSVRNDNSWRRFSFMDVLHLAVVAEVIQYNFRIEFADNVAHRCVSWITTVELNGIDVPDTKSFDFLAEFSLQLKHSEPEWDEEVSGRDRILSSDEVDAYGTYCVVRPALILRAVALRMTGPDKVDLVGAYLHDKALEHGMSEKAASRILKINENSGTKSAPRKRGRGISRK